MLYGNRLLIRDDWYLFHFFSLLRVLVQARFYQEIVLAYCYVKSFMV